MDATKENPYEITEFSEAKPLARNQRAFVKFTCVSCGKDTIKLALSVLNTNKLICPTCARKEASMKKFGVDNPAKAQASKDKSKATSMERYGADNPMKTDAGKKRCAAATLAKLGATSSLCLKETHEKARKTKADRYGSETYNNQGLRAKTNLALYGAQTPAQNKDVVKRMIETNQARYGGNSPLASKDVRLQAKLTLMENYGVDNPFRSSLVKDKIKHTMITRYGVEYISQLPEVRKRIFGKRGPSGPERRFAEMLTSRGIVFEQEFSVNGKCFDFAAFNGDGTLNTLVEIDGEYFHGLLSDTDGHHVHGEKDAGRFSKVPNGVKFLVIDAKNLEAGIAALCANFDVDYEAWIKEIINSCSGPFPYPEYSDKRMSADWKKLCGPLDWKPTSAVGQSIIRHFHKSIWEARVGKYPSPVEAWADPVLMEKCVRNRFIYSSSLSSQAIADGFNVNKLAPKVSVFRASLAKHVAEKYLVGFDEVFDPFSGFSGRMLGVCAAGKKYVGQDLQERHVTESNEIIEYLGLNAVVTKVDIHESTRKFPCLFTCPPYSKKESWGKDEVNKSCDDWIDECLKRFDCKKYVFVVDSTTRYSKHVTEAVVNKSHFGKNDEFILVFEGC